MQLFPSADGMEEIGQAKHLFYKKKKHLKRTERLTSTTANHLMGVGGESTPEISNNKSFYSL